MQQMEIIAMIMPELNYDDTGDGGDVNNDVDHTE